MPLFTRRRLQAMLIELTPQIGEEKGRDLVARLEDKRVDQALPAELELAILWGLSQLGSIDVEPNWWNDTKRPDAYTESLVTNQRAIIEIAAPSDNSIAGEAAMDGIARKISTYCSQICRGLGEFLYYRFGEESGYEDGKYFRRRLAPVDFEFTREIQDEIRKWIETGSMEHKQLRILGDGLSVDIERTKRKQIRFHNVWCSMPPETHSVTDNPLFKLLERKLDQIRAAPADTQRFIFLGDSGSTLINRIGRGSWSDPIGHSISGAEIVSHFVKVHSDSIEAVVVIVPRRENLPFFQNNLSWKAVVFSRPKFVFETRGLEELVKKLPQPRFEGYQARSLFRQGLFNPKSRGWALGTQLQTRPGGPMIAKISSRSLLDLLAGRITIDQFRNFIGTSDGKNNVFQRWLDAGYTVQDVEFLPGGTDEDDDLISLIFKDDPAARSLLVPKTPNAEDLNE